MSAENFERLLRDSIPTPLQEDAQRLSDEGYRKFHTDPQFHATAILLSRMLHNLESIHQLGDERHAGIILAAGLERLSDRRMLQAQAWERGMADAKLSALGIKPAKNPYLEES